MKYIKHQILNEIIINKIISIHYYEFSKTFKYDGESHDFWEMVYVDKGAINIKADKKNYTLSQGEIIFHKPNEFHSIYANEVDAANVFVFSFDAPPKSMVFFKNRCMQVPPELKKIIAAIVNESEKTFQPMKVNDKSLKVRDNAPYGGQQLIRTYLEQFLILLIRTNQKNNDVRLFPTKESLENHLVGDIIEYLKNNMDKKINMDDVCEEFKYSKTYLSSIFRKDTGYTIIAYWVELKIKEAKRLIRSSSLNFSQISDKLAFDNPHYFARVFKRVTKMTPSEYKNSIMNL